MSNLERSPQETLCGGTATLTPVRDLLPAREVPLGGPRAMVVRRTLPHRELRTVGAWCFLDHYGPQPLTESGMDVPPHPHTGLQTVTWLIAGEVLHRDSLGSEALIRPGQLNLMTAGRGIAHSEQSVPPAGPAGGAPPSLHGVQLWVALPDAARAQPAHFEHHPRLPQLADDGVTVTVLMGSLGGGTSPAATYTPLLGAEVELAAGGRLALDLDPDFEHAALAVAGSPEVDGEPLPVGPLLYLGTGRRHLEVGGPTPARLLLLGGAPFEEELVMWWNFVARDHDEIVTARADWAAGRRFAPVPGYPGDRLAAPALPTIRLTPRRSGRAYRG